SRRVARAVGTLEAGDLFENAGQLVDGSRDVRTALVGVGTARVAVHPHCREVGGQPGESNRATHRQVANAVQHARIVAHAIGRGAVHVHQLRGQRQHPRRLAFAGVHTPGVFVRVGDRVGETP